MDSAVGDKDKTTRRKFVKNVAAGAAALAFGGATALRAKSPTSMLSPTVQSAQGGELKYRKCFLTELKPEEREKGFGAQSMFVVFSDNDIIEGCHFFSAMYMGESATKIAGHGPHKHKEPEVLVALGTDPSNPNDLGAEFELYMGAEMEKHVISKPTLIYIPANTIHCPFRVTKVQRPFMFIQAQYGLKLQETPLRDLVPADMRDKYIFIEADGNQKDVYIPPSERRKPKPKPVS